MDESYYPTIADRLKIAYITANLKCVMSNDRKRQYIAEFKTEAVKLGLNGRSVNDVADRPGINHKVAIEMGTGYGFYIFWQDCQDQVFFSVLSVY